MKIGYIFAEWRTPVLRSSAGSVHIQEICSALSRLGHEIFVVAPNKGDQEATRPELPAIQNQTASTSQVLKAWSIRIATQAQIRTYDWAHEKRREDDNVGA